MPTEAHNRVAWNRASGPNCPWSKPVTAAELDAARDGQLSITIAGPRPVPRDWLGELRGRDVLCLGSGGGQQAPLLAAAGASVTLLDISEAQLAVDAKVCTDHGLEVRIEQGTMTDLDRFTEGSFDLIVNPVSNPYVPDVRGVWQACARVTRAGGRLVSGSINPLNYLFEENEGEADRGLAVHHALPFVESETFTPADLEAAIARKMLFTWSHSLEDLVQGQVDAGFLIGGLHESRRDDARAPSINRYAPTYIQLLGIRNPP